MADGPTGGAEAARQDQDVFAYDEALELLGGEEDLLAEMIEVLLDQAPESLKAIQAAAASADSETLAAQAHRFKGSVSSLGGKTVSRLCQELEDLGNAGRADAAAGRIGEFERELGRLVEAYTRYLEKVAAP